MDFLGKVKVYLFLDYKQFSERELAWVISEKIKISSFPFIFTTAMGTIISIFFDGNNLYITNVLKEFDQIETIKVLFFTTLPMLSISIFSGLGQKSMVNHIVNWCLYWCFMLSTTFAAFIIGGCIPLVLGFLKFENMTTVYTVMLVALIFPSLFYGMALLTKSHIQKRVRSWMS